jgi:succinate-acetate transporter protein
MPQRPAGGDRVRGIADPGVQIVLRPLASALPLGFFAFGVGTMLLTGLELEWIPPIETTQISLIVLCFVAPLQLASCLLAFAARDVGAGTALGLFGGTWTAMGTTLLSLPPASTSNALGVFMCALVVPLLALALGAATGKPVLAGVLLLGAARFGLTGVYELTANHSLSTVSGWLGVPLAALAGYFGLALLMEDAQGRTVLPLLRRADARMALEGPFEDQVEHLHHEAGVRRQL